MACMRSAAGSGCQEYFTPNRKQAVGIRAGDKIRLAPVRDTSRHPHQQAEQYTTPMREQRLLHGAVAQAAMMENW
jgi:hypothetical protein